jgi:hypothetical protein
MERFYFLANTLLVAFFSLVTQSVQAGPGYWQQRAEYKMEIDFNVEKHQFTGAQELVYTNNSPDTLDKVFYHLYFNAFQPGSMMDVRSRTIEDPDRRVRDRISKLQPHEIGYLRVKSLRQNGKVAAFEYAGTILEVSLLEPIYPGGKVTFDIIFEGQVPVQIRRSGRNNAEGIDYSMSQWYPKMAEYDAMGWHANPYIGREFHGVWGDFDVTINIHKDYVVAATGALQNPQEIGHGYEKPGQRVRRPGGEKLSWHFIARDVHDFLWAADPDYEHTIAQVPDGPTVHFFYQTDTLAENWRQLPDYTVGLFEYMNEHFGQYPYDTYSVIQGGDGGMEYPMATLITGHRSLSSLVSVTIHEVIHSWYQGVLATNESLYAWMDEGFTSYATAEVKNYLYDWKSSLPQDGSYRSYFSLVESGKEEPLSTHADHFSTNRAYGAGSYSKGAVFLSQLQYIIGKEAFDRGMKRYFKTWKFKHPTPNDLLRIMEKESGLELDWYWEYWVYTTKTIDYAVKSVISYGDSTYVTLERQGAMPMPVELQVELADGRKTMYYAPLVIMRGEKPAGEILESVLLPDWPWTHPTYTVALPLAADAIKSLEIDPSERMADIDRSDNQIAISESKKQTGSR